MQMLNQRNTKMNKQKRIKMNKQKRIKMVVLKATLTYKHLITLSYKHLIEKDLTVQMMIHGKNRLNRHVKKILLEQETKEK